MLFSSIINQTEQYIYNVFQEKFDTRCLYHNIIHTSEVVNEAKKIAVKSGVTDIELEIIILAAYFHDLGYSENPNDHETISMQLAEKFLTDKGYLKERLDKVKQCIWATKLDQEPKNLLEEIIKDADLHHVGSDNYFAKSNLLRTEFETIHGKKYTDYEWIKGNIDFFIKHKFYTKFAKDNYEEQKQLNLLKLQKKLRKLLNKEAEEKIKNEKLNIEKEKLAAKKEISNRPERSVETMWRNTMRTHVNFSSMADNKAHIMISVNTLLLTVVVAFLIKNITIYPQLILPTFILTTVTLVSLIYAVLVTRPIVTSGTFTNEDVLNKKVNLLFFGNFYKMNFESFNWGMNELMNDKDFLYDSMIKDYYYLGQVLGKKYKHLRISYNIFMFGLIVTVITFAIVLTLYPITGDMIPIK